MLRPYIPSFALASLLVGFTAAAQAVPAGRSVVLTGKAGESPLIYLAPGTVTAILLDAPIRRESIQVEGRARFAVFEVGDQGVTLSPAVALGTGERLALRVTYREGLETIFLKRGLSIAGTAGKARDLISRPRIRKFARMEVQRLELWASIRHRAARNARNDSVSLRREGGKRSR